MSAEASPFQHIIDLASYTIKPNTHFTESAQATEDIDLYTALCPQAYLVESHETFASLFTAVRLEFEEGKAPVSSLDLVMAADKMNKIAFEQWHHLKDEEIEDIKRNRLLMRHEIDVINRIEYERSVVELDQIEKEKQLTSHPLYIGEGPISVQEKHYENLSENPVSIVFTPGECEGQIFIELRYRSEEEVRRHSMRIDREHYHLLIHPLPQHTFQYETMEELVAGIKDVFASDREIATLKDKIGKLEKLIQRKQIDYPNDFDCAIFSEFMSEPVFDMRLPNEARLTVQKSKISEWIARSGTCPVTRNPLKSEDLWPDYGLMRRMADFYDELPASDENPAETDV